MALSLLSSPWQRQRPTGGTGLLKNTLARFVCCPRNYSWDTPSAAQPLNWPCAKRATPHTRTDPTTVLHRAEGPLEDPDTHCLVCAKHRPCLRSAPQLHNTVQYVHGRPTNAMELARTAFSERLARPAHDCCLALTHAHVTTTSCAGTDTTSDDIGSGDRPRRMSRDIQEPLRSPGLAAAGL